MEALSADLERSIRRSRLRMQVLLALSSLGEAYCGQLARHVGASPNRVRAVLEGRLPHYREELSLVRLGMARRLPEREGRCYAITPKGKRKARSLVAAWTRHGQRGRARGRAPTPASFVPPPGLVDA